MTTPSAQTDRFVHDRLPPRAQWPELRHDLPELQFPDQVNLVERLLDGAAAKGWADRPLLRSPQVTFTYAEVRERVDRIANHLMHGLKLAEAAHGDTDGRLEIRLFDRLDQIGQDVVGFGTFD